MADLFWCRTCARPQEHLLKLFDGKQTKILKQMKKLTGKALKYEIDVPQYICQQCLEDLKQAYAFRVRLLTVQYFYTTPQYLQKLKLARRKNSTENNIKINEEDKVEENKRTLETFDSEADDILSDEEDEDYLYDEAVTGIDENTEVIQESIELFETDKIRGKKKLTGLKGICDQCGKVLPHRGDLKIHQMRHEGIRPFQCDICAHKCYTRGDLQRHKRTHTGERPFACEFCDKKFGDYSSRDSHRKVHENVRPYACTYCDKAFKNNYNLKVHLITHTRESRFNCTLCKKIFQCRALLVKHYRSNAHIQNEARQDQSIPYETIESEINK